MTFIDKLENLLLSPGLQIFCEIRKNERKGLNVFEIKYKEKISDSKLEREKEYKEDGIKEMIAYLKDPTGFKDRKYTHYSLEFIGFPNGKLILEKIFALDPTDDELIYLHRHVAAHFGCRIMHFGRVMKEKESLMKIIKEGLDGTYDDSYYKGYLSFFIGEIFKIYEDTTDDEYCDLIFHYVRNSKCLKEKRKNIEDIIVWAISDKVKAEELLFKLYGEKLLIKDEFIEKKVIKVVMDDFYCIRNLGLEDESMIRMFLRHFETEINHNIELLNDTLCINYLLQPNQLTKRTDHVLIIDNISGNNKEIIDLLFSYQKCCYDIYMSLENNCLQEVIKQLKENPSIFKALIMDNELLEQEVKETNKKTKI